MDIIGIVYNSKDIENSLQQSLEEADADGILVGLAFGSGSTGSTVVDLKIYKIFYQPTNTPVGEITGLNSGYYGIEVPTIDSASAATAMPNASSDLPENTVDSIPYFSYKLGISNTADDFLNQSPVIKTGAKVRTAILEFSDEIGPEGLPEFGFSFFRKENILSHISEGSHIVLSGSKITLGIDGVSITNASSSNEFFNLKMQTIRQNGLTDDQKASAFISGKLTGRNSSMSGRPCPPFWGDGLVTPLS